MSRSVVWVVLMLGISEDLGKVGQSFFGKDTNISYESSYTSCAESTSTEAEDKDLVSRLVVVGDELIAFADDLGKSFARYSK